MEKKLILTFLVLISIISLTRSSLANVDPSFCKDCHGAVKPLTTLTKDCMACHGQHGYGQTDPKPTTTADMAHNIHQNTWDSSTQTGYCTTCHTSPVDCTNCHNTHDIVNKSGKIDISYCISCHGALPTPTGHSNFRSALSGSKHIWMDCKTCHLPLNFTSGLNVKLHFKDLIATPINNSIELCRICHSPEYNGLKKGAHGTVNVSANVTCVDCHNPHTTSLSSSVGPTIGPRNMTRTVPLSSATGILTNTGNSNTTTTDGISAVIDSTGKWLTDKVPFMNNPFAISIILIVMLATYADVALTKHEEGKKVAYSMVKIQAGENTFRTLEIKLKDMQPIDSVNKVLSGIGTVLGTTSIKENNSGLKYVVFVDVPNANDNMESMISEISAISGVESAEVTDKYEL
jgi:hypothetical protein